MVRLLARVCVCVCCVQWLAEEMDAALRRVKGAPFTALSPVRISFQHTVGPSGTGGGGNNGTDGPATTSRPSSAKGLEKEDQPPRLATLLKDIGGGGVDGAVAATDLSEASGLSFREQVRAHCWACGQSASCATGGIRGHGGLRRVCRLCPTDVTRFG